MRDKLFTAFAVFMFFITSTNAQLHLTGVFPVAATANTMVRVQGTGFLPTSIVKFGPIQSPNVSYVNQNLLFAVVPVGLQPGIKKVSVQNGGTVSNKINFTPVKPSPGQLVLLEQTPSRLPVKSVSGRNVIAGDVDGNNDVDVALITLNSTDLYINDGDGVFSDQTAIRLPASSFEHGDGEFCDVDNDGDPDLIIVNLSYQNNQIYINDCTGNFSEESFRIPQLNDFSLDVDAADVDNDGDFDFIIANSDGQTSFLINDGNGYFVDEAVTRGITSPISALAAKFFDVDNDGDLDLLLTGAEIMVLYINNGSGYFTDESAARIPQLPIRVLEIRVCDADNDSYLDLFLPSLERNRANRILINNGTGIFNDESPSRLPLFVVDAVTRQSLVLNIISHGPAI